MTMAGSERTPRFLRKKNHTGFDMSSSAKQKLPPPVTTTVTRFNIGSSRSLGLSDITFSEVDESEGLEDQYDVYDHHQYHPFLEDSFLATDHQPGIPQRRRSESVLSVTASSITSIAEQDEFYMCNNFPPFRRAMTTTTDVPPLRPIRQISAASASSTTSTTTTTASENRHNSPNAQAATRPPLRPTRKLSLASTAISGTGYNNNTDVVPAQEEEEVQEERQLMANSNSTSRMMTTTTTTTEPTLEYLQHPAVQAAAMIQELSEQARIFKQIVHVRDRQYHIRTFPQCFVGSEAVDRMIQVGLASSRSDAVELGRAFMKYLNLFRHVCDQHIFKDKYLFYRFCNNNDHDGDKEEEEEESNGGSGDIIGSESLSSSTTTTSSSSTPGEGCIKQRNSNSSSTFLSVAAAVVAAGRRKSSRRKSEDPWYSLRQRRNSIAEEEVMIDD